MRRNKIKQMWRDGKYVTLGWLSVSHGFTAEIMARQGFDALCIDLQHGTTELNHVWPSSAFSRAKSAPVAGGAESAVCALPASGDRSSYRGRRCTTARRPGFVGWGAVRRSAAIRAVTAPP